MTDAPEEPAAPPAPPPEPPPPEAAPAEASSASPLSALPWTPILIGVAVVIILLLGVLGMPSLFSGSQQDEAYVVQPFTPATELITARERVEARAEPDVASPVVVMFGQGVTLNVSGRVQRGLGNDWYAISWNERTAFVRVQDVVAGSGAPPVPIVRERTPQEEEDEEDLKPDELTPEGEEVAEAPSSGGGALGVGDVNWVREPSARDFARFYPDEALDKGQSGNVVLSCIIGGSGRLACSVASESPPGSGFGSAAIGISRQLRVRTRLPDGSSAEGREMRLPLTFRAN